MRSIAAIGLLVASSLASATDRNAATCSASDVQSAMNAAVAGDRVVIPSGSCSWTTQVSRDMPANTSIIGAGTTVLGGGDATNISDAYATNAPLLQIGIASTGVFRISGITFKGGSGAALKDNGMLKFDGPGVMRMDHVHLNMTTYSPMVLHKVMWIGQGIRGVLDHSILDLQNIDWIHFVNGEGGSTQNNGDTTWSQPTGFGTADFFYVEDNQITGYESGSVYDGALTDCHSGGKFALRFNSAVSVGLGQTHPTGHSVGDDRGCRAHEIYGNSVTSPLTKDPNFAFAYNNSGPALIWGNSVDQVFKNILYFNNCRRTPGYSESDGCGYTQNSPPNGWGQCGNSYGPSAWDGNTDSYGYPCIDQPGRGQGDLLTGSYGTSNRRDSVTGTQTWPNQASEPVYEWNTTGDIVSGWSGNWVANLQSGRSIAQNRDFYLHHGNTSCNAGAGSCTAGVGVGTLAQRPANCTTGVAYWASDQGSWNKSTSNAYGVQQNGADGQLYKCTATNTWTLYYVPYTYPHPLQTVRPNPVGTVHVGP